MDSYIGTNMHQALPTTSAFGTSMAGQYLCMEEHHRQADEEPVLDDASHIHGQGRGLADEQEDAHVQPKCSCRQPGHEQRILYGSTESQDDCSGLTGCAYAGQNVLMHGLLEDAAGSISAHGICIHT